MLHSLPSKNCRTNQPNKVITYLKGRQNLNGTIYDYSAPLDSYGNPSLQYSINNVVCNESVFGFSGGGLYWSESTKYCYNTTIGPGCIYLNYPLTPSTSYNFTFMCRFYINQFPSVEGRYNTEASSLMFNGNLEGTGFGIFIIENSTELYFITSDQTYSITPVINAYTWYSLVITIENVFGTNSKYTSFLNGTKVILGTSDEVIIDEMTSKFSLMGAIDVNENVVLPFNGYMTDILVSYDVVPDTICLGYSLGGNIL
jgi:hypothetical protein